MTRTYEVILESRGDKKVTREMPKNYEDAREMAVDIATRNDAWLGSRWSSRDGDEFGIGLQGELEELTD